MSNFSASGAPPSSAEGKVPAFADAVQRAKEVRFTKKPQFVFDLKGFSERTRIICSLKSFKNVLFTWWTDVIYQRDFTRR